MIAPLTPFAIHGVIWYQDESNASELRAYRYRRLFGAMIEDWRKQWGEGDFPFLFVQLANYQSGPSLAREQGW
ncbi:MAG: sialate O-acetylesterase [Bryobacteraceae bacterium]